MINEAWDLELEVSARPKGIMRVSILGEKRRYGGGGGGSCDDQKLDTNRVALRWDCAMILRNITRLHSFFAFLLFA